MSDAQQIDKVRAIISPANLVQLKAVTDNFYQELDQEFDNFKGHMLVSQASFNEPWSTWEIHPQGDELVFLIEGETDLVLWNEDGKENIIRMATAGEYVVVPKATWHTARPHKQSTVLFITPGEGTINSLTPGGEPL
jgi:mannose-6-phosphate isomerase-like protein (cupin superfamily)